MKDIWTWAVSQGSLSDQNTTNIHIYRQGNSKYVRLEMSEMKGTCSEETEKFILTKAMPPEYRPKHDLRGTISSYHNNTKWLGEFDILSTGIIEFRSCKEYQGERPKFSGSGNGWVPCWLAWSIED